MHRFIGTCKPALDAVINLLKARFTRYDKSLQSVGAIRLLQIVDVCKREIASICQGWGWIAWSGSISEHRNDKSERVNEEQRFINTLFTHVDKLHQPDCTDFLQRVNRALDAVINLLTARFTRYDKSLRSVGAIRLLQIVDVCKQEIASICQGWGWVAWSGSISEHRNDKSERVNEEQRFINTLFTHVDKLHQPDCTDLLQRVSRL